MYYLSIRTAKNDEPYVLLMREAAPDDPTATNTKIMWSETYRSLSGAKNLIRVLKAKHWVWRMRSTDAGIHSVFVARNNRILMSGSVTSDEKSHEVFKEMVDLTWANLKVRDERRG